MSRLLGSCLLIALAAGCGGSKGPHGAAHAQPRPVSLQVEVYDPVTNGIWENLGVRIVQSDNEWSQCVCESVNEVLLYTDTNGTVYFSGSHLADAEVGFQEDIYGRAVLGPLGHEDEAWVTIEVGDPTLGYEYFEVRLSYQEPDLFVSVPFSSAPLR
jgi:hypothetical protein